MAPAELDRLLARARELTVAVVGDFFVDRYLHIDPALAEVSLETGLEAHQVVAVRAQPGAAGTVTNNLSALGVGRLLAVGYRGDDGEGYELERALAATRVDASRLLVTPLRRTPTYTKPLVLARDAAPRELGRLDIKNRAATPRTLEDAVLGALDEAATLADALIVADQVDEAECGVVTSRVRARLSELAARRPELVVLADSRRRIGLFAGMTVKPNADEARAAFGLSGAPEALAVDLARRMGRPVFLTRGADGVVVGAAGRATAVPGVRVSGPVDIVGAGDSFAAGTVTALAAGAEPVTAAQVGCLVASLTVQQIGTTGTAAPDQVRARLLASPYVAL
jgi:rfaE bifunctional protein kinase chain/domain